MKKKGYNPQAEDVPTVVKIHNSVNEQCWREVMEFEKMHGDCIAPKLKHFQGRPRDFSPKARFWAFVGYKLPFDRHDWVIDRCGKEVRYVLDYYQGPEKDGAPASIYLDIRPALDSVGAGMDRVKMGLKKMFGGNDSKQTQQ
jgi:cytochrome c heme-lyase